MPGRRGPLAMSNPLPREIATLLNQLYSSMNAPQYSTHSALSPANPVPPAAHPVEPIDVDVKPQAPEAGTLDDKDDGGDSPELAPLARAAAHLIRAFKAQLAALQAIPLDDKHLEEWATGMRTLNKLRVCCVFLLVCDCRLTLL